MRTDARDEEKRRLTTPSDARVGGECAHGVVFSKEAAAGMTAPEVRRRFPRLDGPCPLGCGFRGLAYASLEHFVYGDW